MIFPKNTGFTFANLFYSLQVDLDMDPYRELLSAGADQFIAALLDNGALDLTEHDGSIAQFYNLEKFGEMLEHLDAFHAKYPGLASKLDCAQTVNLAVLEDTEVRVNVDGETSFVKASAILQTIEDDLENYSDEDIADTVAELQLAAGSADLHQTIDSNIETHGWHLQGVLPSEDNPLYRLYTVGLPGIVFITENNLPPELSAGVIESYVEDFQENGSVTRPERSDILVDDQGQPVKIVMETIDAIDGWVSTHITRGDVNVIYRLVIGE